MAEKKKEKKAWYDKTIKSMMKRPGDMAKEGKNPNDKLKAIAKSFSSR